MKKKILFSLLGIACCSLGAVGQTYKLTDMTQAQFETGSNAQFRFDQYRLASSTYMPLTIYSDSGRVNLFDRWWPERFQGQFIGGDVIEEGGHRDYTMPLIGAWAAKKVTVNSSIDDKDPLAYIYVARINEDTYETYPTLCGSVALSFIAPADGYYKITTHVMRMDQMGGSTKPAYMMAKYRFRQKGAALVSASSTLGFDCKYGVMEDDLETYTAPSGVNFSEGDRTYAIPKPVTNEFYVYIKTGDMVTAEADMSHVFGETGFTDSISYGAREAWARTRWTQFDAEVVTKEVAEASGKYVDPYSANDEFIPLFQNLFTECVAFAEEAVSGVEVGQFDQAEIDAFWDVLNTYGKAASDPNLLGFTAKMYYENLFGQFNAFKAKAYTTDYSLPENRWLFRVPENSSLYADFEKQFLPKDDPAKAEDSPWDFKAYTVSSGIYNTWTNFDNSSLAGDVPAFYNKASDWLYIAKTGNVHPTPAISPVITFTAAKDGLYHASTRVQRNTGNKNKNYMYTRYRFAKGGIEDGVTAIQKENYMFADPYGHPDEGNKPVSRDFYVALKAGDVITFEEDCYTANTNGSAGTDWEKLMVLLIPAESAQDTIQANLDKYYDPYAKASDFTKMDSVLNAVGTFLESVAGKIKEEPEVGEYPEAAKWEIDDAVDAAKDLRNDTETTQVALNLGVVALSDALSKFQSSLTIRYENGDTFESGAYYIEMDGLYLTVDSFWTTNNTPVPAMYAHLAPIITPKEKNNQVFNVQFNANPEYADPLRFTLTACLKNETWEDDGAYHITEKGEIREGNTEEAQSNTNSNHVWRNHSLIYNGDKWCIFNVQNNWSIVFNSDLAAYPTMPKTKEYLYKFVKFGTPGVGVEEINADAGAKIRVFNMDNGAIGLSSTEAATAVLYNAAGQEVANVQLSHSVTTVTLPAGFYVVKATNGATAKVLVK